MLYSTKSTNFP